MFRSYTFFCMLLCTFPLFSKNVFVNGVKADTLTNQEFSDCTVKFDKNGNIHISAPGIKIIAQDQSTTSKTGELSKRYYISVSVQKYNLNTPLSIYVNTKEVGKLKKGAKSTLVELSKFLKKGNNKIAITAGPCSKKTEIQVLAGSGKMEDDNLKLNADISKNITCDTNGISKSFTLNAE